MAHPNIEERRETVGKVLSAGIEIGSREARVLSVIFGCSASAIVADARLVRAYIPQSSEPPYATPPSAS
jgi:hypothetical protein